MRASKKQVAYINKILDTLDVKLNSKYINKLYKNSLLADIFIKKYEPHFKSLKSQDSKIDTILKKLDFIALLKLLGYEEVKAKTSITHKCYHNHELNDRVVCRIVYDDKLGVDYWVFFDVGSFETKGGNIINFSLTRMQRYGNNNQIINILYDIALNLENYKKYDFKHIENITHISHKHTQPSKSHDIWYKDYKKCFLKNTDFKDFTFRRLEFSFVKTFSKDIKCKVLKNDLDLDCLYMISIPSYDLNVVDNDVRLSIVGDEIIYAASDDFYDIILQKSTSLSSTQKAQCLQTSISYDFINQLSSSLTKQDVPSALQNPFGYSILYSCLKPIIHKDSYRLKHLRYGSKKSMSILGKAFKSKPTKILITENAMLDGISAIKLGYFQSDTLILGTIGNPTKLFFKNLKTILSYVNIDTITIATDNDKAGMKFYNLIKSYILNQTNFNNINLLQSKHKDFNDELLSKIHNTKYD